MAALVSARLHQDVQNLAFAIDGTPKINALAVNLDEDFIEMPARIGVRMRASQRLSKNETKLDRPAADSFIRDIDAALGQQIFDIPKTQGKPEI